MEKKRSMLVASMIMAVVLFMAACGPSMPSLVSNPHEDPEEQYKLFLEAGWQGVYVSCPERMQQIYGHWDGRIEVRAFRECANRERYSHTHTPWRDRDPNVRAWQETALIVYLETDEEARIEYDSQRANMQSFRESRISGMRFDYAVRRRGTIVVTWYRHSGRMELFDPSRPAD